jgi:Ca2+-binding EF-hand superfamily protein
VAVTQPAPATVVAGARAPRSGIVTRKRWKWLRRGAFVAVAALALAVLFKQHAMEREIRSQATQQDTSTTDLQRQATQRFEAADTDHSGDLNREEMVKRLPRFAGRFDEMDANHDGVVSLRELEQFLEKDGVAEEMRQADGKAVPGVAPSGEAPVSPPATTAVDSGIDARMGQMPEPRSDAAATGEPVPLALKKEFVAADINGDGFLSPQEVYGRFPAVGKNFTVVDVNGDGRISLEELWQFRKKKFAGRSSRP